MVMMSVSQDRETIHVYPCLGPDGIDPGDYALVVGLCDKLAQKMLAL
jgi:hypothetical protein